MGRFKKYLNKGEEIVLEYEDGTKEELILKPLGWEYMEDLMLISKDFANKDDPFKNMTKDTVKRMKKLVMEVMKLSYPDEPENELEAFASLNFALLMPIIVDMNFKVAKNEKLDKMVALKERLANARKIPKNKNG